MYYCTTPVESFGEAFLCELYQHLKYILIFLVSSNDLTINANIINCIRLPYVKHVFLYIS